MRDRRRHTRASVSGLHRLLADWIDSASTAHRHRRCTAGERSLDVWPDSRGSLSTPMANVVRTRVCASGFLPIPGAGAHQERRARGIPRTILPARYAARQNPVQPPTASRSGYVTGVALVRTQMMGVIAERTDPQ